MKSSSRLFLPLLAFAGLACGARAGAPSMTSKVRTGLVDNDKRDAHARTEPPRDDCLLVGAGQTYSNLTAAFAALGIGTSTDASCVFVYPGNYTEQLVIDYQGTLDMYGWTTDTTTYLHNTATIVYNQGAVSGAPYAGASVTILTPVFNSYNLNWANSHGEGIQALAMYAAGDKMGFYGNAFYGYQDTLFAGYGYQYYKNCLISGAADFIYGFANAWFSECDIRVIDAGYICAHGRNSNDSAWYVIDHSTVEAAAVPYVEGDNLTQVVYLGRPWGVLSRVIYQYSHLGNVVRPAGWTTMAENATPIFEEYANWGPGANTSERVMETEATGPVTMEELWPEGYDWIDSTY